jgi:hypothetical protein
MDDYFRELLGVDQKRAFEFFLMNLREVIDEIPERKKKFATRSQTLYATSILAHYAQVSTQATTLFPAPRWPVDIFDRFIIPTRDVIDDLELLETAGAQTLLIRGFFRDRALLRNPGDWYDTIGADFFRRASLKAPAKKHLLLEQFSNNFIFWAHRFQELQKFLHDKPYLIRNLS